MSSLQTGQKETLLFIEEMTYNLLENGSIKKDDNRYSLSRRPMDIHVPATIQGIIAARLTG